MHWILIIIIISSGQFSQSKVEQIHFANKELCETAKKEIEKDNSLFMHLACFDKYGE